MHGSIGKLANLGGPALGPEDRCPPEGNIAQLTSKKNGFYAFESALHVFPWGGGDGSGDWWNSQELWKSIYETAADGLTFFAEDIFGFQFACSSAGVFSFDPETALREKLAQSMEDWAREILEDYEVLTGHSVAHDWQAVNGPLPPGYRLAPSVPFFMGGGFSASEMKSVDRVKLLNFRADVYRQTKDLPDGTTVRIEML